MKMIKIFNVKRKMGNQVNQVKPEIRLAFWWAEKKNLLANLFFSMHHVIGSGQILSEKREKKMKGK